MLKRRACNITTSSGVSLSMSTKVMRLLLVLAHWLGFGVLENNMSQLL